MATKKTANATPDPDRRTFLSLTAAGALLAPGVVAAAPPLAPPKVAPPPAPEGLVINALGGLENPNAYLDSPAQAQDAAQGKPVSDDSARMIDARSLKEAHASGLTAVNITIGYVAGPMEPFEHSVRDIAKWDVLLRNYPNDLLQVLTADDILRAKKEGKMGVIYGFQNAAQIGDKPDRVDLFADFGVRIIQLTYNPRNVLGDGSAEPENKGLTPLGVEVVQRLNANKVLVDLAHSGERTCLDAIKASQAPIAISHTGCRALCDLPRNKTDAELRLMADKGGVAGVYFMPFLVPGGHPRADDVVRHIEHAIKICGEDHVGIGTDGSVSEIDDLGKYKTHLAKEVEVRRAAGIGAAGERADTYPFVIDLRGPDQFRKLAEMLRRRRHSAARIDKILGLNFLRLMREVWPA